MKHFPLWILPLLGFILLARAEEANGLRLTAQKTLLEKKTDRDAFNEWDKVDKALGLKVAARNISLKDLPAGTLGTLIIVKRWGTTPVRYDCYSSSMELPALLRGAETNLIVGKVPIGGYEIGGNHKQFEDSIEGWQITVTYEGKVALQLKSTSSFDKLLAKAKKVK